MNGHVEKVKPDSALSHVVAGEANSELGPDAKLLLQAISISAAEEAKTTVAGWVAATYSAALKDIFTHGDLEAIGADTRKSDQDKFAFYVYLAGIGIWATIWGFLYSFEKLTNTNLGLFGSQGHWIIFLIPPQAVAFLALISNAWFLRQKMGYSSFERETKAIDFVERHASFFLVGSSVVFFFASFSFRDLGLRFSFSAFIIYETLSLICLSMVLLLYWFPHEGDSKILARLRHVKTIPFTFAVSFFLAALMIITTAALP